MKKTLRRLLFCIVFCLGMSLFEVSAAETVPANSQKGYVLEDGTVVDGIAVNIEAKEYYSRAFKVLELVNRERSAAGVEPLVMDKYMMEVAMQRIYETVLYWCHTRPSGTNLRTISLYLMGENIAGGQYTPEDVMEGWMNSSGHKANILDPAYTRIGIGCIEVQGTTYWIQCFGCMDADAVDRASYVDGKNSRTVIAAKDPEYYTAKLFVDKNEMKVGQTQEAIVFWGRNLENSGAIIESSNPSVCTVSGKTIKAVGTGKATISMYFPDYKEGVRTAEITVSKGIQVKVRLNPGKGKIKSNQLTVFYDETYGELEKPVRKGCIFDGWYTRKNGGDYISEYSEVNRKKDHTLYAQWYKVNVGKTGIKKVTNISGKKLKATWKWCYGAEGYQVVCATNSKFSKNKKTINVEKTSAVFSGLKKNKTYYVKVRGYALDSMGKKVYGKYSSVDKIKIKK